MFLLSEPDFCHGVMCYSWVRQYPVIIDTNRRMQSALNCSHVLKKRVSRGSLRVKGVKVTMRHFHCTHFSLIIYISNICLLPCYCAMYVIWKGVLNTCKTIFAMFVLSNQASQEDKRVPIRNYSFYCLNGTKWELYTACKLVACSGVSLILPMYFESPSSERLYKTSCYLQGLCNNRWKHLPQNERASFQTSKQAR